MESLSGSMEALSAIKTGQRLHYGCLTGQIEARKHFSVMLENKSYLETETGKMTDVVSLAAV